MTNTQTKQLTLHLLEDRAEDSRWSVVRWGPLAYLTCSRERAELIVRLMNEHEEDPSAR